MKLSAKFLIPVALLALTGCSSLDSKFTNRIGLTLAGDELLIHSFYGPWGITTKADAKDRDALLNIINSK